MWYTYPSMGRIARAVLNFCIAMYLHTPHVTRACALDRVYILISHVGATPSIPAVYPWITVTIQPLPADSSGAGVLTSCPRCRAAHRSGNAAETSCAPWSALRRERQHPIRPYISYGESPYESQYPGLKVNTCTDRRGSSHVQSSITCGGGHPVNTAYLPLSCGCDSGAKRCILQCLHTLLAGLGLGGR